MYVYLLQHATEPRFKIGKANDIKHRISSLGGREQFNLAKSLYLKLADSHHSIEIERMLHITFKKWNLPVKNIPYYDGYTEQFSMECFDLVVNFINNNYHLFTSEGLQPIPDFTPALSTKPSLEEHRRIRAERRAEKDKRYEEDERRIEAERKQRIDEYKIRNRELPHKFHKDISLLKQMLAAFFSEIRVSYEPNKNVHHVVLGDHDKEKIHEAYLLVKQWPNLYFERTDENQLERRQIFDSCKKINPYRIELQFSYVIFERDRYMYTKEYLSILDAFPKRPY